MPGFLDDYEPVEDRIRAFWEDHPQGRILTYKQNAPEGEYVFSAEVYPDGETVSAMGWAHESVAQLPANMKASALEVCETSAIGRALANLGYAPKGKRPSREEMSARQEPSTSPPADGAAPVGADMPGAAPTSSGGEGPSLGEGEDPIPSTTTTTDKVDSLWRQLDQFAGSRAKAINAINKVCRSKWTRGNQQYVPIDDLETTLRYLLKAEGVA